VSSLSYLTFSTATLCYFSVSLFHIFTLNLFHFLGEKEKILAKVANNRYNLLIINYLLFMIPTDDNFISSATLILNFFDVFKKVEEYKQANFRRK